MRKTELLLLATTVLLASCSFYRYQVTADVSTRDRVDYLQDLDGHPVGEAPDFSSFSDVNEKKSAFFGFLLPGVAYENQRILQERSVLDGAKKSFQQSKLSDKQTKQLNRLARKYDLPIEKNEFSLDWFDEMLVRVNVIPYPLVLTQAANESAWGTSRFARQGNNYFGQWCYQQGCGLVPLSRVEGMTHEVAKFKSAQQSIHNYFMNVNRNAAYQELRQLREALVEQGKDLLGTESALHLTDGLLKYSERGLDYVNDLKAMIRHNQSHWETHNNE
ncbi:glucosaminidase domain-containing protein [Vibrio sp.]|uniref:glucosaminidase domain-containing protein n=1 Tax=Vibrio sp. TaxID=678 RepID=UPI003D130DD1